MLLGQDIRLGLLLILNIAVLAAAIYAARRWTADPLQRFIDVILVWYAVQYFAVGIPGLIGVLSAKTMSLTAILLAAGLLWGTRRKKPLPTDGNQSDHAVLLIGGLFFLGIVGKLVAAQRFMPVADADAITYHVPIAVQWLQSGRLSTVPLWFFNPANTYSPLAGSVFIYWLLAPMHSDAVFRFVQVPAMLLLFASMVQLGRMVGVKPLPAIICGLCAASRMAFSEIVVPGDDIFLAAFVVATLAAFGKENVRDAFGPWRAGIVLGFVLATKYTALISLPMLLLTWGAPRRAGWRWRHWCIAIACLFAMAGPWYLRNLLLTGNPLYPLRLQLWGRTLLPGLFVILPSPRLRNLHDIRMMLVGNFHGPPIVMAIVLAIGFVGAWIVAAKRIKEPLVRACLLGPLLCMALFLAKAPFGEVRFLYPAIFVMCVAAGLIVARLDISIWIQTLIVAPLAIVSLATAYLNHRQMALSILTGMLLAVAGWAILRIDSAMPKWRRTVLPLTTTCAIAALGLWIYVDWNAYVGSCHADEIPFWSGAWPNEGPAWEFMTEHVPPTSRIAFSQDFYIYPLFGDDLQRRLVYVPVRADVPDYWHHPGFSQPVDGETMGRSIATKLDFPADEAMWRQRMAAVRPDYFLIKTDGPVKNPPELNWADSDHDHFLPLFRDQSIVIYQIRY